MMAALARARIQGNPTNAIPVIVQELRLPVADETHPYSLMHPGLRSIRLSSRQTAAWLLGEMGGSAKGAASDLATIGGRRIVGQKGGMEEGGGLVPFIINWRGVTPAGRLNENFTDASDLLPTFAEIAGAPLPGNRIIDGKSLLPQIKGEVKSPRTWVFTQLGENFHVREAGWKLNQAGQLFDMKNAPFEEIPVPADSKDATAVAARQRLSAALAELNQIGRAHV